MNIPWVLHRMPEVDEVILVDANSTDGTVEAAQQILPSIRVLQQAAPGKGAALATGLLAATGDIAVMIDADGSMDPAEIPSMVGALLAGADVVKGSRTAPGGGSHDISTLRSAGNWGLTMVANTLFRQRWSELCYGYAAFWTDVLDVLELADYTEPVDGQVAGRKPYGHGFEIEALLFCRSARRGLRVAETFSWEHPRMHGESNLATFKDGWRVLNAIVRERAQSRGDVGAVRRGERAYPVVPHLHSPYRDRSRNESVEGLRPRVMLVGPGEMFTSGITHYTARAASAINEHADVSLLLMRRLCPEFIYPGRERVGRTTARVEYPDVPIFDGVDWFWGESMAQAHRFLEVQQPDTIVMQWWTGTVAHSYLSLASKARELDARVVLEMHEILDVGEAGIPAAAKYSSAAMRRLLKHVDAVVVHSQHDVAAAREAYAIPSRIPIEVIHHGPFDHYDLRGLGVETSMKQVAAGDDVLELLYAGVIREYKGLDDLAEAMRLAIDQGQRIHLTVVGEVWQQYRAPLEALAKLPHGHVTVIEGYVSDEDFAAHFAAADAIVLPYRRCSASGPLHVAMSMGKPVLTTEVGGLAEAARGYGGAVIVPPHDAVALAEGFARLRDLAGHEFADPHSWDANAARYLDIHHRIQVA